MVETVENGQTMNPELLRINDYLPATIRKDISKRDMMKFCRFHNGYGHDTNLCNQLKDEIEFLIRQGHLRRYVRVVEGSQLAPVAGTLLTIC